MLPDLSFRNLEIYDRWKTIDSKPFNHVVLHGGIDFIGSSCWIQHQCLFYIICDFVVGLKTGGSTRMVVTTTRTPLTISAMRMARCLSRSNSSSMASLMDLSVTGQEMKP
jgi:hypothetical protein